MHIQLKGKDSGLLKEVKLGFSWTTFFFGFLPALFRGDLKWAIIMLLLALCTFYITWLMFPFIYNKLYIKELLEKGYVPANEQSKTMLINKGIISS
ncbi:MAG: DUF2628 domain-containing protein [Candidatus Margulisbacteria bacterium]|nr:DUF2628 domain-containing protein [Candidatus Margulisiibacteriota bacterium]